MTQEVKKAILQWLSYWKTKGLSRVKGENMAQAELLLLGSCKQLWADGSLHSEFVIDILEGLCICCCTEFKEMFQVMLQMAKLGNYCVLDTISHDSTPTVRSKINRRN